MSETPSPPFGWLNGFKDWTDRQQAAAGWEQAYRAGREDAAQEVIAAADADDDPRVQSAYWKAFEIARGSSGSDERRDSNG